MRRFQRCFRPVLSHGIGILSIWILCLGVGVIAGLKVMSPQVATVLAAPAAPYLVEGVVADVTTAWPLYAHIVIQGDPSDPPPAANDFWTDPETGRYSVSLASGSRYTLTVTAWPAGYQPQQIELGSLAADRTLDIALAADQLTCTAPGYGPSGDSITLLQEGFETTFPPPLWQTIQTGDPDDPGWQRGQYGTAESVGQPHSGAYYAWHNDVSLAANGIAWLVSPPLTIPLSGGDLSFWERNFWTTNYYRYHGLWISTSNCDPRENAFSEVIEYSTATTEWTARTVDLAAYAGQTVCLAFRYEGNFNDEWYLDDLTVTGNPACAAPDGGLVVGNVFAAEDSTPLNGVTVRNDGPAETTTVATPLDDLVPDGFYLLYSQPGNRVFTATLTSHRTASQTVSVRAGETIRQDFYLPAPQIVLTKTVGLEPDRCAETDRLLIEQGSQVTYCYTLTNIGQGWLTRHTLLDDRLGLLLDDFPYNLAPGASLVITQAATITTDTINYAVWTAANPGPTDLISTTALATITTQPKLPDLVLTKTVSLDPAHCATTQAITIPLGLNVTYCYQVHNNSPITFTDHTLTDDQLGPILAAQTFNLPPGQSRFITKTVRIDDPVTNLAVWTATNGISTSIATAAATVHTQSPAFSLQKTVGLDPETCPSTTRLTVPYGTEVTYCYIVRNTGGISFTTHSLVDSRLGVLLDGFEYDFFPGQAVLLKQTVKITQTTTNRATWTMINPYRPVTVSRTATATVIVPPPSLVLTKTVGLASSTCPGTSTITTTSGAVVTYCYQAQNTGGYPLSENTLVDDQLGDLDVGKPPVLTPGAVIILTRTAIISRTTVNLATWTGQSILGPVQATATTRVVIQSGGDNGAYLLFLPTITKSP